MVARFETLKEPEITFISSSSLSPSADAPDAFFRAAEDADHQERHLTPGAETRAMSRQTRGSKRQRVSPPVAPDASSLPLRPPKVSNTPRAPPPGLQSAAPAAATLPASAASTSVASSSAASSSLSPSLDAPAPALTPLRAGLPSPSPVPPPPPAAEGGAFHRIASVCEREGIVWTKTKGHPFWPTQLVRLDGSVEHDARLLTSLKFKRKSDDVCVMYFGTCQVAWITQARSTISWQEGLRRRLHLALKQRAAYRKALGEVLAFCARQRRFPRSWWCEPSHMKMANALADAWERGDFQWRCRAQLENAQRERVCWVKLRGHPHWPAQVLLGDAAVRFFPRLTGREGDGECMPQQWPCMFFGTGDVAMVSTGGITPFATGIERRFVAVCKRYDFFVSVGEAWGYLQKERVWPSGSISGRRWWNHPALDGRAVLKAVGIGRKPKYDTIRRSVYAADVGRPSASAVEEAVSCTCKPGKDDGDGMKYCRDDNCLNVASRFWCDPKNCPVGDRCANVPFFRRKSPRLAPFYTSDERGWGLRVEEDVCRGDFIIGYVGEILDLKELERRLDEAQRNGRSKNYIMDLGKEQFVDAERRGNKSRFINSSCDPNCDAQKWMDTARGQTHVGIFALHDIKAGSEITFNYFQDFVLTDKKDDMKFECKCGADTCCMINPEDREWIMKTIGRRINVKWDDGWYMGTVESYSAEKKKFKIAYDDGDVEQLALGVAIKQGGKKGAIKFRFLKKENR